MVIPKADNQATEFVSGMFETHHSLYIDPYKGVATGIIETRSSDMYKLRKIHGERLLGSYGTNIIELIGSWMVVSIITALYVWWPKYSWRVIFYFIPRIK